MSGITNVMYGFACLQVNYSVRELYPHFMLCSNPAPAYFITSFM
jgi:hypothetical protein